MRNARPSSVWTFRDTLQGSLLSLVAVALLASAGFGLTRELTRIPANRYFVLHDTQLEAGEERYLHKAAELYARMPDWTRGAVEQRRLGFLRLMEHKNQGSALPLTADEQTQIVRILTASLRQEPVHPLTWAYLAEADIMRRGDLSQALRYLKQSYRVAPIEPDFFFYRLDLALQCRAVWDAAFLDMIRAEIKSLFPESGTNPNARPFIRAIKSDPRLMAFVTRILKQDEGVFQRFEAKLR